MPDFIPGPDGALLNFANVFCQGAAAYGTQLGIPAAEVTAVTAKKTAFAAAYAACQEPAASSIDVAAKNTARAALVQDIRRIKNKYIDTAEDLEPAVREAFGLPPRDDTRTSHPAPAITVGLKVRPVEARRVEVERVVAETGDKATPYGMDGAILVEKVGGAPPAIQEELGSSRILKHFKTIIEYPETDRGKPVWYAARWQNNKGDKGGWSDIVEAYIP